jgi:hypothetical protein
MTSMTKGESAGRMSYEIDGYSHGNNPIPAVARIANTLRVRLKTPIRELFA